MELTIDQALQQGIAAHKEGKLQDAEKLYRAILSSQPNHPDANHNLGVIAVSVKKSDAALPLFKTALEANPKVEQFWLSYIDALIKGKQLDSAKEILQRGKASGLNGEKIDRLEEQLNGTVSSSPSLIKNNNPSQQQIDELIRLYTHGKLQEAVIQGTALANQFPSDPAIPNILGAIYAGLSRYKEAIASYNKAIDLKPDYAEAHYNLGIALNELGENGEAVNSYNKAIDLKPDHIEAYNNLGVALNALGKHEEAIASYDKAIDLKLDFLEAYNNRGLVLIEQGHNQEAINSFNKAIELKPDYAEAYSNLGIALRSVNVNEFSDSLAQNYLDILNCEALVRPARMVSAAITLLKHQETIKEAIYCKEQGTLIGLASDFCLRFSEIPLFIKIMEVCPIPDLEIEELLTGLRRTLLLERNKLSITHDLLSFQSALALQCFTNEFIYEETEEETIAIQSLEASLQQSFSKNEEPLSYDIACLASYRSLFEYPWATNVTPAPALELLFKRQVTEANQERLLKEGIPSLNPVKNDVSVAVQNQYEENPYPRWVNIRLEIKPLSIKAIMAKLELQVNDKTAPLSEAPQVLVAGCGTGQHALGTASRFKNSHITAIDLSLSSLAYAKRKTAEFGVTNIDYLQADILDLGMLDKQFDIIESAGVLHHMAEPLAGWRVLSGCLKPGGLMKIGLYSELARQNIVKARSIIAEKNIASDKEEMLKFRRQITELNDPEFNLLKMLTDFYSTSELRDLLFHVQEHRFTIPQISEALDELGLIFMGFEFINTKKTIDAFKKAYPKEGAIYDLDNWHEYETLNPRLFASMYQFWAQKS